MVSVHSRGAIFLNTDDEGLAKEFVLFPSPLGELYFLIRFLVHFPQRRRPVSVPSRGAIFLNTTMVFAYAGEDDVSVPSRGAIFLNGTLPGYPTVGNGVSVPSRGAIFLNGDASFSVNDEYCFRPLSGSYIS